MLEILVKNSFAGEHPKCHPLFLKGGEGGLGGGIELPKNCNKVGGGDKKIFVKRHGITIRGGGLLK